jgi:hypothetical protein
MKEKKPTKKPAVDREQRTRNLQRTVIVVVSVILILSWVLSLVSK